jgi:N-acetylglutamate synthase-like GNAT family acetyltransferase
MKWKNKNYSISTSNKHLDVKVVHAYLTQSYWAEGIGEETVKRAIRNSMVFGVYDSKKQIGFARVVTDKATFAYLADVFILNEHQGKGLGKWLVKCILNHAELQGLRRIMLATRDAQPLYAKFGFAPLHIPERFMQLWNKDAYKKN